jgi:hypothetical protein
LHVLEVSVFLVFRGFYNKEREEEMAKLSRKQRKAAKVHAARMITTENTTVKKCSAAALVAVTVLAVALPVTPVEAELSVPAIVQTVDEESNVIPLPRVESITPFVTPEDIDRDRKFDLAMRECFEKRLIRIDDVLNLVYRVTLCDFLRSARWSAIALERLRVIDGIVLWSPTYVSTSEGEDVWRLFRRRIRREGAHFRIVNGSIRRDPPIRKLYFRPTHRAA